MVKVGLSDFRLKNSVCDLCEMKLGMECGRHLAPARHHLTRNSHLTFVDLQVNFSAALLSRFPLIGFGFLQIFFDYRVKAIFFMDMILLL